MINGKTLAILKIVEKCNVLKNCAPGMFARRQTLLIISTEAIIMIRNVRPRFWHATFALKV